MKNPHDLNEFFRKLNVTCENKDVIRELLENILQIDADIEMPDISEWPSSKKRSSVNDKDFDQDPDNGSSSGSPPPSKQSKKEPEDNNDSHGHDANGNDDGANGFGSEDSGEFRQNSVGLNPVKSASKNKFSNFHLPISPPHDVVFDEDEDEFDDIPLPLLEPETQLEDGPETSEELMGVLCDSDDTGKESKTTNKLKLSSIKASLKSNPINTKFANMKFGQANKHTGPIFDANGAKIKTEFDPEGFPPLPGTSSQNKSNTTKGAKSNNGKGKKTSGKKGGLLSGNEFEPLSAEEFEVKQELLEMQDSDGVPIDERQIKQETLEDEMRQAFDYYGKNASSQMPPNMNLPLPPNLPLPH